MAQPFCLNRQPIQRACHNAETPMPTFRRFVTERFIKIQQFVESSSAHNIHDPFVIFRPFF